MKIVALWNGYILNYIMKIVDLWIGKFLKILKLTNCAVKIFEVLFKKKNKKKTVFLEKDLEEMTVSCIE